MSQSLRFILTISISLILTVSIASGVFLLFAHIALENDDLTLDKTRNIVVIGNSQPATAFNDTILHNWKNFAGSSFYMKDIAVPLDRLLTENQQVDTVILGMSVPTLCLFPDHLYMTREESLLRLFVLEILCDWDLMALNLKNPKFLNVILLNSPEFFKVKKPKLLGAFEWIERHNIANHRKQIDNDKSENPDLYRCNYKDNKFQFEGIEKILDVCHKHGVTCILFDTPHYDDAKYFDDGIYWEYISSLDPSLTVADYHSFALPDTTYYADITHLNREGAKYFSEYIKSHGLETVPISEYAKKKTAM